MGSLLDRMEPLLAAMPTVKSPEGHVHFKNKLLWTAGILILYFALTNIPFWGLDPTSQDIFHYWRALLAGSERFAVATWYRADCYCLDCPAAPKRCGYPPY